MKTEIKKYLELNGYQQLTTDLLGLDVFFSMEIRHINALVIVDADSEPEVTTERIDSFLEQCDWKAPNGQIIDVHPLTIIYSKDVDKAREIGKNQMFCWYINPEKKELIIDEGKCEDFYGIKGVLEKALAHNPQQELPHIYEVKEEPVPLSKPYLCIVNYFFLALNIGSFILSIFWSEQINRAGILDIKAVYEHGQWYRMLTSAFLHGDVYHLAGNIIFLYLLGNLSEKAIGHVKYAVLYVICVLAGNAASLAFSVRMGDFTPSLGASGAVFGIVGAYLWITLRNRGSHERISSVQLLFLIVYLLYQGFTGTNVDNAAHIGGLLGGFLAAVILYRKSDRRRRGRMDEN